MRIITGTVKNKEIKTPKGFKVTRPALAKVREAIFSSLGSIEDKVVMDIFAGSGSLGLEALSRGAKKSYFVENHQQAVSCIIHNLEDMGFSERARVFKRTMPFGLKSLQISEALDIIFCDPPYDKNLLNPTLSVLAKENFLNNSSLLIVEHSAREMPAVPALELVKQKKYGQTFISYLKLRTHDHT